MSQNLSKNIAELQLQPDYSPQPKLDITSIRTILESSLRNAAGTHAYNNWLRHLSFSHIDGNTAIMQVPTKLIRDFIIHNYFNHLLKSLRDLDSSVIRIDILIDPRGPLSSTPAGPSSTGSNPNDTAAAFLPAPLSPSQPSRISEFSPVDATATFETFVCGQSNHLSYLASQQIANEIILKQRFTAANGYSTKPHSTQGLCIHGKSGLGKTHLLHSIVNHIRQNDPSIRIGYFSAEKFTQSYVTAVKSNGLLEFKSMIDSLDIILVDDIQFICERAGTKKEMMQNLESLMSSGKFVVMATDRSPQSLNLDERSRSRIVSCMVVQIEDPEHELRLKILKNKLKIIEQTTSKATQVSNEMLVRIADNFDISNIREIEGVLYKFVTYCELTNTNADNAVLIKIINDNYPPAASTVTVTAAPPTAIPSPTKSPRRSPSSINQQQQNTTITIEQPPLAQNVLLYTAQLYSIDISEITGRNRNAAVLLPRKFAAYILRRCGLPLKTIGYCLGRRDHSTVSHMIKAFTKELETQVELRCRIETCLSDLHGSKR